MFEALVALATFAFIAAPVLLVIALVQIAKLRGRVERLESARPPSSGPRPAPAPEETPIVSRTVIAPAPPPPEPAPTPPAPASPPPPKRPAPAAPPPPAPEPAATPAGRWQPADLPPATPGPEAPAPPVPTPAPAGRAAGAVKRWFTTGNVPVKVGVILSLLGLGFLLQTALNRGWITPTLEMRLAAAAVFGLVMLGVGWWARSRNLVYALSMQGGGTAVLYLTVYAALIRYEVLSGPAAIGAVVVITVGAGILAVVQDSRSLAVLGIIGGFLAPILISVDDGSHLLLFSYIAVLNLAVLAVTWFKSWPEFNLLGWAFTWGISAHWIAYRYTADLLHSVWPLIILFAILYAAAPLFFARRAEGGPVRRWAVNGPLTFGTPFAAFALLGQLVGHTEYGLAGGALGLAALHLSLMAASRLTSGERTLLGACNWGLGMIFVAIAVPLAFDSFATAALWAAQGAGIAWLNLRQNLRLLAAGGWALQGLAGFAFLWFLAEELPYPADTVPLANRFFTGALLLAAGGLFSAWLLDRERYRSKKTTWAVWTGMAWGLGWLLGGAVMEIVNQSPAFGLYGSLAAAAAVLGGAFLLAPAVRWPRLNAPAALLLPVMAVVFYAYLAGSLGEGRVSHPLDDYGWAAWPFALAVHYLFLRLREERFPGLARALHGGGLWAIALLIGFEVHWQVQQFAEGIWPTAAAYAAALAAAALPLPKAWGRSWPLGAHRRIYLTSGSGVILIGLAAAAAASNIFANGDPRPLLYLPLLNPLEAVTVLVAAVAFWWRSGVADYRGGALSAAHRNWNGWTIALGMIVLTMATARAVHHWLDVPFTLADLFGSTILQASLSILWGVAGLSGMILGQRRGRRPAWIAGASLMGVVVVKLFLIDLGNTGALTRVVSFLGVGVLLLVVGYFAPVPPAAPRTPDPPAAPD